MSHADSQAPASTWSHDESQAALPSGFYYTLSHAGSFVMLYNYSLKISSSLA